MNNKKTSKKALRMEMYAKSVFEFYKTIRHGYVKVPRELLKDLKIDQDISDFSYRTKIDGVSFVYLEEDRDAAIFLGYYERYFGHTPELSKIYLEDDALITSNPKHYARWWLDREMLRLNDNLNMFWEKMDEEK